MFATSATGSCVGGTHKLGEGKRQQQQQIGQEAKSRAADQAGEGDWSGSIRSIPAKKGLLPLL